VRYRQLGRAGLRVSTLTLGTATFGNTDPNGWACHDLTAARRQIDLCLDAGVNLIDTSNAYAVGRSEEILGEALAGRRDSVLISTKVRFPVGDGVNDAGLSRHHILRQIDASLRRLRTDHVDIYHVHEWDGRVPLGTATSGSLATRSTTPSKAATPNTNCCRSRWTRASD
jgi:aryl-alcohol dehydrogenase-like predicted oxidoreductase